MDTAQLIQFKNQVTKGNKQQNSWQIFVPINKLGAQLIAPSFPCGTN